MAPPQAGLRAANEQFASLTEELEGAQGQLKELRQVRGPAAALFQKGGQRGVGLVLQGRAMKGSTALASALLWSRALAWDPQCWLPADWSPPPPPPPQALEAARATLADKDRRITGLERDLQARGRGG